MCRRLMRDVGLPRQERREDVLVDELQVDERRSEPLAGTALFGEGDLHLHLVDQIRSHEHLPERLLAVLHQRMVPLRYA